MKILFICKHNRFRSKIAEAVYNKLNKNKLNNAKSAGIICGNPVAKIVIEIAKKHGLNIKNKPQGLSTELLIWGDIYVIVADDVPTEIFNNYKKFNKKLIVWKIKDTDEYNKKKIEEIMLDIENKIKSLIKELQ